jgi:GAF domain-containing protein
MSVNILREISDHFDWVGIYLVRKNDLVLEAYAGDEETEYVRIPIGQGICGSAAKKGATIVVPDVSKDPGYPMCFASTRSEIVVPIKGMKGVFGRSISTAVGYLQLAKKIERFLKQQHRF